MPSLILIHCRDLRMGVIWENLGALTTVQDSSESAGGGLFET